MAMPKDLLTGIDRLDPLPITIQRLFSMLGDEFTAPREIANAVEYDQAIAATLLKVANSPVMGSRITVQRVSDAVMRLGVDQILNIALGAHFKQISRPVGLYALSEDELWLHGALASVAAKEISAACTATQVPQSAPVAALVHDIGKLILVRYVEEDMDQVLRLAEEEGLTFVQAEQELFGFDHAEVGAAVAERWSFPEDITDAIAKHHTVPIVDPTPMLDTLMLSNMVAKTIGVGLGAEGLNLEVDGGILRRMGFRFDDFARICSRTTSLMEDLQRVYGLGAAA
jgi:putative nucleotidyltransferase with HDIG domain